ncbi:MAG: permease [gamma proteobacterium symbiont of Lucinoma myriamae]|nr:permease [gamma proteobacterium symbiont of Lucinoma myriamae]MCU7818608.1 permease [gamma proteobacterium symbiont of Lucinoma myriamae]MCU7832912.1 permease [gamma proteobacterium symbiont of Lucinoma myriamae]
MKKNDNTQKKKKFNGRYLLPLVCFGYALLYSYCPDKTLEALSKSLSTMLHLLPVFLVVIMLMGIFTALLSAERIAKLLGNESGLKGWGIAVFGGILSHGSSYIWYQMLANLREHKVKDALIVTFLYTRAIKLPWLPLMVSYFGYAFTILLMFYIIIGALFQGLIIEKINQYRGD